MGHAYEPHAMRQDLSNTWYERKDKKNAVREL